MNLVKDYLNITDGILSYMENGNVFFSKNYSKYAKDTGASVWYLYDENYILPVLISEKITIKYGLFVSEPMCYSEETGIRKKVDFLNVANQIKL